MLCTICLQGNERNDFIIITLCNSSIANIISIIIIIGGCILMRTSAGEYAMHVCKIVLLG